MPRRPSTAQVTAVGCIYLEDISLRDNRQPDCDSASLAGGKGPRSCPRGRGRDAARASRGTMSVLELRFRHGTAVGRTVQQLPVVALERVVRRGEQRCKPPATL